MFSRICSVWRERYASSILASLMVWSLPQTAHASWFDTLIKVFTEETSKAGLSIGNIFAQTDKLTRFGMAIAYILTLVMALWLCYSCVIRILRVMDNRETQTGLWLTMLTAGLLLNLGEGLAFFSWALGLGTPLKGLALLAGGSDSLSACAGLVGVSCEENSVEAQGRQMFVSVVMIFKFVGLVTCIRALLSIKDLGEQRGQKTMGKISIQLVAGIILMNSLTFAVLLMRYFAPGTEEIITNNPSLNSVFLP